jgi:hypothetical protein
MIFRAVDEPAVSRPEYWQHVISDRFRAMDVRTRTPWRKNQAGLTALLL